MGLLLHNDKLFQTLIREIAPVRARVAADLDIGSFAELPFVTHFSLPSQDSNGRGLWTVVLNVSIFDDPSTAFELVDEVYTGIQRWDELPTAGVVPGVGGVEAIENEISAFSRVGGEAQMENKSAIQFSGSWQLAVRKF
ncbi:hypothetical protein [Microbacterium sp. H6]|uniref:hypothetical protein n=1 Tax=Microbacterium sp. H6 TaxID=421122 RepID=UPI000DE3728E|nr:hypothetical protein [Microbacterium sp. H6]RBO73535.1 hypothetical protein DSP71_05100 [Microbacterium sp. H6]